MYRLDVLRVLFDNHMLSVEYIDNCPSSLYYVAICDARVHSCDKDIINIIII